MTTQEKIQEMLRAIPVPQVARSLVQLNLVRSVEITDSEAKITLAKAALPEHVQDLLQAEIAAKLQELPEIERISVEFVESRPMNINRVERVVAVMSGKGGVGKSLVTALTATSLTKRGKEVGILDADITGPSIPKMFGASARPLGNESGLLPVMSRGGVEIMSMNMLLNQDDDAVIWRGPLIAKAIHQFWEEVLWGTLDYLVVDLPPGTADVPLTVMQSLPLSGVIIVFTPQDLTNMVVRKAVKMANQLGVPILGVVENMSYFYVPDIDKQIEIFGPSRGDEMAKRTGVPLLGRIPLDPELARLCDEGNIELYRSPAADSFSEALARVLH